MLILKISHVLRYKITFSCRILDRIGDACLKDRSFMLHVFRAQDRIDSESVPKGDALFDGGMIERQNMQMNPEDRSVILDTTTYPRKPMPEILALLQNIAPVAFQRPFCNNSAM
jgi:hypothetical protein